MKAPLVYQLLKLTKPKCFYFFGFCTRWLPTDENCLKCFLDKNSQKQPMWVYCILTAAVHCTIQTQLSSSSILQFYSSKVFYPKIEPSRGNLLVGKRTILDYRKVASTSLSRLEAYAVFFILSMKEKFDVYLLWPFVGKLISVLWICVNICDFMVFRDNSLAHSFFGNKTFMFVKIESWNF